MSTFAPRPGRVRAGSSEWLSGLGEIFSEMDQTWGTVASNRPISTRLSCPAWLMRAYAPPCRVWATYIQYPVSGCLDLVKIGQTLTSLGAQT